MILRDALYGYDVGTDLIINNGEGGIDIPLPVLSHVLHNENVNTLRTVQNSRWRMEFWRDDMVEIMDWVHLYWGKEITVVDSPFYIHASYDGDDCSTVSQLTADDFNGVITEFSFEEQFKRTCSKVFGRVTLNIHIIGVL